MTSSLIRHGWIALLTVMGGLAGCSFNGVRGDGAGTGNGAGTAGTIGTGTGARGGTGVSSGAGGSGEFGVDAGSCATQTAKAMVLPVYLAFAFDVSGSMGAGDYPWHDRTLKWDPITAATKAFFADPASAGFSASLTFFPSAADKCEDGSYLTPDVAMTALPSAAHGTAIDAIGRQTWRGGTPTLHVVRGVISTVRMAAQRTPGRYVIVMVTDGYPQGCDDNDISSVSDEVRAVAAQFPTYVIGVNNPPLPGAPDTVSNLTQIATAGGTDHAYIIDTGDPARTAAAFKATIDSIRGAAVSCVAPIPPAPAGSTFDPEKVVVTVTRNGATTKLSYDPACAGNDSWHYDSVTTPRSVVLCPSTCTAVQADPNASLSVEFTCTKQQIVVP